MWVVDALDLYILPPYDSPAPVPTLAKLFDLSILKDSGSIVNSASLVLRYVPTGKDCLG